MQIQQAFEKMLARLNAPSIMDSKMFCLIDGYFRDTPTMYDEEEYIEKGDQLHYSIAAASVLAKVYRDRKMVKLSREYGGYGFDAHKGYGTSAHLDALKKNGVSDIHRVSYKPVAQFLKN